MEYLVGFLVAFLMIYVFVKFSIKNQSINTKIKKIQYNQSYIHSMVYPYLVDKYEKKITKRQSRVHDAKTNIKVIIMENKAYWIKDNAFYVADMSIDGSVNKDTTRIVDTMTMNRVQLDKMMFILDRLREENYNDSSGSGDQ